MNPRKSGIPECSAQGSGRCKRERCWHPWLRLRNCHVLHKHTYGRRKQRLIERSPGQEHGSATRLQDTMSFFQCLVTVREIHNAKTAGNHVKTPRVEGQRLCIRQLEFDLGHAFAVGIFLRDGQNTGR